MNDLNELQTWLLLFCFVLYYVLLYRFRNHKYLRWWKEWLEIVRNEENLKLSELKEEEEGEGEEK